MYLTKICMNSLDRKVWNLLRDPYHLHAGIMTAFPESKKREDRNNPSGVLFRREPQEKTSPLVSVLVQSLTQPEWAQFESNYSHTVSLECRDVKPDFINGQRLPFRLRVNPVVTRNGKRFGLVGEDDHREWLRKRAIDNGFMVNPESFKVIDEGFARGEKWENDKKFDLSFRTVIFEGHLQVIDRDIFIEKGIKSGIGPAKGFGCGLLSVPYRKT